MPLVTRISFCLLTVAIGVLPACAADETLVFDATSSSGFQSSAQQIEAALNSDERQSLKNAIRILSRYPLDGNCSYGHVLQHLENSNDPTYRHEARRRLLDGLNAEQVIALAKEKNCEGSAASRADSGVLDIFKLDVQVTKENYLFELNGPGVGVWAEPYPRYANIEVKCLLRKGPRIDVNLYDSWQPSYERYQDERFANLPPQAGQIDMQPQGGKIWDRGRVVYFDDVETRFPPTYRVVMFYDYVGDGEYKGYKSRLLNDPIPPIYEILLPKLKTAKIMRLENPNGIGPTFDLTGLKSEIEKLEAQCVPEDSHK